MKSKLDLGVHLLLFLVLIGVLGYFVNIWSIMYSNSTKFLTFKNHYSSQTQTGKLNTSQLVDYILLSSLDSKVNRILGNTPDLKQSSTELVKTPVPNQESNYSLHLTPLQLNVGISVIDPTIIQTSDQLYQVINEKLHTSVVQFPGPKLGTNGVVTIYGHSSQLTTDTNYSYFDKLGLAEKDQIINIVENTSTKTINHQYVIISSQEIETNDVDGLKQEYWDKKENTQYLFLVTCWPLNTTHKRWVVIAKLIN